MSRETLLDALAATTVLGVLAAAITLAVTIS